MAWRTPRTWAALDKVRSHWLNEELVDNPLVLRGLNSYGVQLSLDEEQGLTNDEIAPVSWSSAIWQVGALWTSGTDITIPVTGYWLLQMLAEWKTFAGNVRRIGYTINGRKIHRSSIQGNASAHRTYQKFRTLELLSAGDVVVFHAIQNTGGDLSLYPDPTGLSNVRATVLLRGTS